MAAGYFQLGTSPSDRRVALKSYKRYNPKGYRRMKLEMKASKSARKSVSAPKAGRGIISMFPPIKFLKLEVVHYGTLTSSTLKGYYGSTPTQVQINCLTTPVVNGTRSVQGLDQLASIYNLYKVSACRARMRFFNPSQDGLMIGYRYMPSTESDDIAGEYIGDAGAKKWTYSCLINDSGSQVVRRNAYAKVDKIQGLNPVQFKSDTSDYMSLTTSDPTKKPKISICVANTADTTAATCEVELRLTYYCMFTERVVLAVS